MARYIDLGEAIAHLRNKCYEKYPLSYTNGIAASINELRKFPTADVAPKSEVEQAKQEVAREIFEEIEKLLALNILAGDVFTGRYFDADLENDIAELKKKYTGDQT